MSFRSCQGRDYKDGCTDFVSFPSPSVTEAICYFSDNMECYQHSLLIVVILATCSTLSYSVEPTRYEVKELGGSLVINCTSKTISNALPSHWVLTDLSVLNHNNQNEEFKLLDNGFQLHIGKVEENAIGEYFCVLTQPKSGQNDTLLYFKSIVFKYEKSTWEEYKTQTIVGVVAAVITLVVLIGLCLVYRYRWTPEKQDIMAVNGGYDTADPYYPEKDKEKGFINEPFATSNQTPAHGVITDDTKF